MADRSAIEWTDASWTPIRARNVETGKVGWHCEHVSEGCRNCYAEGMNKRLGTGLLFKPGHRAGIEIFLDEKMLLAPLKWRDPRMVFVCSMTDLFADFVPDEMIDKIFAVMALCSGASDANSASAQRPQHTFQVLTKRSARMRAYMATPDRKRTIYLAVMDIADAMAREAGTYEARPKIDDVLEIFRGWGPFPNVWLGVSAEDQQRWNERTEDLRNTPAAMRFVSVEPMLGAVNRHSPGICRSPWKIDISPDYWGDFQWPEWVPSEFQRQIEDFWRVDYGRGPRAWLRDMEVQCAPPTGSDARVHLLRAGHPAVKGRYLHCWNNIGRVQLDDGSWHCCSVGPDWQEIDWVIAGGESGREARPMHPDWARSLRDQCVAAGVPFFFKQWGEWAPVGEWPLGSEAGWPGRDSRDLIVDGFAYRRVGKKAAGALLDGREWKQWPATAQRELEPVEAP